MRCEYCRYMYHILDNTHVKPTTMFCSKSRAKNEYCTSMNIKNQCKYFTLRLDR